MTQQKDQMKISVLASGSSGNVTYVETEKHKVLIDAGLSGKVKVVGFDVTDSNTAYLKKGAVQFLIDQGPYAQGYHSIRLLTDAIFQDKPIATTYYNTGIQIKNLYNC